MLAAMEEITSRGASPSNIRIICIVTAPPALKILSEKYPGTGCMARLVSVVHL
jgi:uracil phosphoribosyltransferase